MRLEILTKVTGWYGAYSGYYERIPEHVSRLHADTRITRPVNSKLNRIAGKLFAIVHRYPSRNQSITIAEEVFSMRFQRRASVGHILCTEDNHLLLKRWSKAPRNLVGTIHYPPELLNADLIDSFRRLSSAIVLYSRDVEFFEKLVGRDRVVHIPHGVDLDFFRPGLSIPSGAVKRLVYVGQFGRDTAMFGRIVPKLLQRHPDLEFHVVTARPEFADRNLRQLYGIDRVHFHSGIADLELLEIYQKAIALLLPMKASGANNAIIEALSCGLPVLTTDVGGIWDYGGGTLFPVVRPGDDDSLIDLATEHLDNPAKFKLMRRQLREFAEENLDWSASAERHLAAFLELNDGPNSFTQYAGA
jgi:glycosyltransferase involved in cell wall biosynthesis